MLHKLQSSSWMGSQARMGRSSARRTHSFLAPSLASVYSIFMEPWSLATSASVYGRVTPSKRGASMLAILTDGSCGNSALDVRQEFEALFICTPTRWSPARDYPTSSRHLKWHGCGTKQGVAEKCSSLEQKPILQRPLLVIARQLPQRRYTRGLRCRTFQSCSNVKPEAGTPWSRQANTDSIHRNSSEAKQKFPATRMPTLTFRRLSESEKGRCACADGAEKSSATIGKHCRKFVTVLHTGATARL